jgi:multidrug efflux pump subunit AcrB
VIHRVAGSAGVSSPGGPAEQLEGSNVGRVSIELRPSSERSVDSTEIEKRWRANAGEFPGAERLTFSAPQMGPPGGAIEFKLLGDSDNFAEMERFSEEAQAQLAGYPGVFDVQDDSRVGNWEFQISVKDRAQSLGITLERIAQTVRSAYYGAESKRVQRGRHEVKIMVRLPEEDRTSISQLGELYVRGDDGEQYPISEVADLEVKRGYAEINRLDQKRSITISADLDEHEANAEETIAAFKSQWLDGKLKDHPRLSVNWEGQAEQTRESMNSLFRGFVVSMAAIYFLLALQFRSYFQPFMIMFVIPFGLIGAIAGHFVMGLDIALFSMFGLVALTGVVVNDSIVLVEFINQQIEEGIPLKRALLDASGTRFRPIMLTGITTVVGLFPMLLETSFQAQFLIPMATSICFGLMMTAPLAIFQVPVFYLLYAKAMMPGYPIEETDPPYLRPDDDHGEAPQASGGGKLVGAHAPEPGGA